MCLAFAADGKTLATGGADRTVRLWDPTTRRWLLTLTGLTDMVTSLAFTADGRMLASGAVSLFTSGETRLWQAATAKEVRRRAE
jgi:WD40 repeat protein